ncbi:C-type lectin domain family 1 member B-like isoform X2 [Struthio camelus]|uniref:C-type lectin domain family 1 member B-like isoform X2 n=1 Tax=Struthio camelus TaxID=8801 RepID=UPI003603DF87
MVPSSGRARPANFWAPFVTKKREATLRAQNAQLKDAVLELQAGKGSKCVACLEEWEQRGDTCYHFSRAPQPWGKCVNYCKNLGSKLLQIDSEVEMEFIKIQMQRHVEINNLPLRLSLPHWLGLSYNVTRKLWCWLDGTVFPATRFKNGPKGANRKNFCGIFLNGHFTYRRCRERHRCICRK